MARSASKAVAPKVESKGMSVANVDAELSKEVANLKQQIGQPTGRRIQLDNKAGKFISPEGQDLGDSIRIVILDFVSANRYYESAFDPDNPSLPVCFAFGRIIADMAPNPTEVLKIQNDTCKGCPWDEYGTAKVGKGKACKNTREIAFLLVDEEAPEAHNEKDAPVYTFSVPPTGVKAFDGVVNGVMRSLNGPPIKAIVTMSVEDMKTYSTVTFTDPVPNPDYASNYARRAECEELLIRKPDYSTLPQKTPQKSVAKKAAGRGR